VRSSHLTALQEFSHAVTEVVGRSRPAVATVRGDTKGGTSSGSGFLIDGVGHVVTNHHVIDGCGNDFRVQFANGEIQPATLVGSDPLTDLAVIRATESLPSPLVVRTEPPILGEICLAIGSPLGEYAESVSMGIVSGLARTIPTTRGRPLERAIQTDAAINPGNSGGPLLDAVGHVLGINTCVDVRAVGIGFAVPGETIDWVARQILQYGDVRRGALGIGVATRLEQVEGRLRQAPVVTLVNDEVAEQFRSGDIITHLDGRPVRDRADIFFVLSRDTIGRVLPVDVWRNDEAVRCQVKVKEYTPPAVVNPE
jgi:serine protease Do